MRRSGGCGAWSPPHRGADRNLWKLQQSLPADGRPLTGARIETILGICALRRLRCRPLTGARIETRASMRRRARIRVAPSQGRGSKPRPTGLPITTSSRPLTGARIETGSLCCRAADRRWSPPHRGADRNWRRRRKWPLSTCRPLTGARIETNPDPRRADRAGVAPSQGRGSKHHPRPGGRIGDASPPHRGADRNRLFLPQIVGLDGRPLTGARIETRHDPGAAHVQWSPPHRGADRNPVIQQQEVAADGRPLTGARIETVTNPSTPNGM